MNNHITIPACAFATGDKFFYSFFSKNWQKNSHDKTYAEATPVGRLTYNRTWKSLERFCRLIEGGKPFDAQCLSNRYIGIEFSEEEYMKLINPIIEQFKALKTQEGIKLYIGELEKSKSLTVLEKRIMNTYSIAVDAFSPVPSLSSICKLECEKLGLIEKDEFIVPIIEDVKQQEAPHQLPDRITDHSSVLTPK